MRYRLWVLAISIPIILLPAAACCFGGQGSFTVSGPTTHLSPGFSPDPLLITGAAGGPLDVSTQSAACVGFIPIIPTQTLNVTAPMHLRLMAQGDSDLVLAVRLADGTYLCNDDGEGLNPIVEGDFAAGQHNVYVGTLGPTTGPAPAMTLGVTTRADLTPSTMAAPAVPEVTGGYGQVLRSGVATVRAVTGSLSSITVGSTCSYTQTTVDPAQGFDCRWHVQCGTVVVYGSGTGGYSPCQHASWPPGSWVYDQETQAGDRDPSLTIQAGTLHVRDDATGELGAYDIEATLADMI